MKALLAIALIIVVGWSGVARPEVLRVFSDPAGSQCHVADPGPGGVVTVYVILKFTIGATGVSFSAPMTAGAGLEHVSDTLPPGFSAVGSSQTQVDVSFGTCLAGSMVVMEMNFVRVGAAGLCTPYGLQPGASFTDCTFIEKPAFTGDYNMALNADGSCYYQSPYRNPFPPNGATDVLLNTPLSWDDPEEIHCIDPIAVTAARAPGTGLVYFGTTTNPPYHEQATLGHYVGQLSPGTTYYWRINAGVPGGGPLWSFTTASILPTKRSTWGAIKALYH